MTNQKIAEKIVDAWELLENESMRERHRYTLERIIICALEKRCFTLPNGDCVSPTCDLHK